MTGTEMVEEIHAMDRSIRVLYMSGYTEGSIIEEGVLKAGIEYIHKPFPPTVLASKIREMLDAKVS
jgi:response regulator RpfG family c-di-GMP phosphodiesterase